MDNSVPDNSPPPPAYKADAAGSSVPPEAADHPPQYTFPTSFIVGARRTDGPFVTIAQIKRHLALLHALAELKRTVVECQDSIPHMPPGPQKRWAWFVNLATERWAFDTLPVV